MKTKNILMYGAIAAGAYLAYKFLFKKNTSDANFANANGGFTTTTSGSVGGGQMLIPSWLTNYVNTHKTPSYIWKPCWTMVQLEIIKQQKQNKIMSNMAMQQMFEICVNQKIMQMQMQANLGSSSVRNTATM